ncbi:MAG: hypothetical protein U0263_39585 [Polyangiaceae bacterium]
MSEKALSRFTQPISVPGRRLLHHVPLHFVLKKVTGGGQRAANHEIPLIRSSTSCSASCSPCSRASRQRVSCRSTRTCSCRRRNVLDMTEAPMIAITGTQIMVDGVPLETREPSRKRQKPAHRRALQHPQEQA